MNKCVIIFLLLLGTNVVAQETIVGELADDERDCYAAAMIGYDSVINSRVGVVPEHAIELTSGHSGFSTDNPLYRDNLRNTIWSAYLWKGSPHTYAVKTFAGCIRDSK